MVLAACSGNQTALTSTTSTVVHSTTTTKPGSTTSTTVPPVRTFNLFFVRGSVLGVANRTVGTVQDPRYAALENLVQGPNASEASQGLGTEIPQGTVVRGLQIKSGVATINFSPNFVAPGSPSSLSARLAQVVYTLTDTPNVTGVVIEVGRTQVVNFAGVNLSSPVGRSQVTGALPGVLLENPAVGSSLKGQLEVAGSTSFSGTYDVQLTDASGKLLANVTNTAVVGGQFQQFIPFTVSSAQTGTVHVFAQPNGQSQPAQAFQFTVPIAP